MFIYEDGDFCYDEMYADILSNAEVRAGGNCEQALRDIGFYPSSQYYPKSNIESMGIEVYACHGNSKLVSDFDFLAAMSACNTETQFVLIKDVPTLWGFLAKHLPIIKLVDETVIDRETHYEQG